MPWTRRAVKYLLSSGSPLSDEQQAKMKRELHENPEMGHLKKGEPRRISVRDLIERRRGG